MMEMYEEDNFKKFSSVYRMINLNKMNL
jgi:hypothetical protein